MKRILLLICILTALILASLIIARRGTKRKFDPSPTQRQIERVTQIVDSFAQVKTRPMSSEEFDQAVQRSGGTNLMELSESDREKLFACIKRFYASYSSGNYTSFNEFRLRPPFTVNEKYVAAVKKTAFGKGLDLKSDEEILRFAWDYYNGTNRIGEVSEESITLSVVSRRDLGLSLRRPGLAKFPGLGASINFPGSGAACWEGSVVYSPTPVELLKKDGVLRFFTLEMIVRFNPLEGGPATPLVLIAYWDPTREDWMPLALCTVFRVNNYTTIF